MPGALACSTCCLATHTLTAAAGPIILNSSTYDVFSKCERKCRSRTFQMPLPAQSPRQTHRRDRPGTPPRRCALRRRRARRTQNAEPLYCAGHSEPHSRPDLAQRVSENLRLVASLHGSTTTHSKLSPPPSTLNTSTFTDTHCASAATPRPSARRSAWTRPASHPCGPAAYLHDIGMVAVDKRLLGKTSRLDAEESREMRDHTVVGHQIVSQVQFPWPQIPEIVRWHHERADGSGYPDGLHGDEIPQAVRIVALAETFDAMTSERPYRERLSVGVGAARVDPHEPAKIRSPNPSGFDDPGPARRRWNQPHSHPGV